MVLTLFPVFSCTFGDKEGFRGTWLVRHGDTMSRRCIHAWTGPGPVQSTDMSEKYTLYL